MSPNNNKELTKGVATTATALTRYLPALRHFFRRRVPGVDADDLVQDVLLNLMRRKTDSQIENVEAYIFTIARNVLVNHHRRAANSVIDQATLYSDDIGDTTPTSERWLQGRESLSLALKAIENMPSRTRSIFLMHRFDDMTYASIARHLGISVSAVEKHIMSALQILLEVTRFSR